MLQLDALWSSIDAFWNSLVALAPRLGAAILVMFLGWLVAKVGRRLAVRTLRLLRVDVLAEQTGMEDVLLRGDVRYTTVTLLANVLYWFVLFVSTLLALNLLGMQAADELFRRMFLYIPSVFVATVVLIFGVVFARFVHAAVYTYLNNIGVSGAEVISTVVQAAVVIFVVSVALEQLQIGGQVLVSAFQIAFGAICLAFALAFGIGGREWAAHVLERLWKK